MEIFPGIFCFACLKMQSNFYRKRLLSRILNVQSYRIRLLRIRRFLREIFVRFQSYLGYFLNSITHTSGYAGTFPCRRISFVLWCNLSAQLLF